MSSSMVGITKAEVLESLGLKSDKLQKWMKKGLIKPTVRGRGGRLHGNSYSIHIFSRTDWLEIKTATFLRENRVGMRTVTAALDYIRLHSHRLGPGEVHVIGGVVWAADIEVTYTQKVDYISPPYIAPTVFVPWGKWLQESEALFSREVDEAADANEEHDPRDRFSAVSVYEPPTDQRSIEKRLDEASQRS